jgi:hypothetical protein
VKVQASWELFNGFATRAATAQAAHQFLSTIDTANFTRRKVAEEVRLAWQALETARERVALLQNAVNIAAEVFDARRKLREAGTETVINVLDAENAVFDARINLVAAQHDARVATYRLLAAMGRLTIPNIASGTGAEGGAEQSSLAPSAPGANDMIARPAVESLKTDSVELSAGDAAEPAKSVAKPKKKPSTLARKETMVIQETAAEAPGSKLEEQSFSRSWAFE